MPTATWNRPTAPARRRQTILPVEFIRMKNRPDTTRLFSVRLNWKVGCLLAILAYASVLRGAVPPAEQILPADTLAVIGSPDGDKTLDFYTRSPQGQLWNDPEMKAFKEKLTNKFQHDVLTPLEHELGVKLGDYADLVHGQLTLALTRNGWGDEPDRVPGWLLIVDAKSKAELLKTNLDNLKKRWVDAGRPFKAERIRDVEFATLMVSSDDVTKSFYHAFPGWNSGKTAPEAAQSTNQWPILVGQSGSLLLAGNSAKDLEKLLVRLAGGGDSSLAEQPEFTACQSKIRNTLAYAWVNTKAIFNVLTRQAAALVGPVVKDASPFSFPKLLAATGLDGLRGITGSLNDQPDGLLAQFSLMVPESGRNGLFQIMAWEAKEAQPPAFVPADAVEFSRVRINSQRAWSTLETMISGVSPEINAVLQMTLSAAGKDKDPDFDFKKSVLDNVGSDFISYQKNPRSLKPADLSSPPSIFLVGSPHTDLLAQAFRVGVGSVAPPNSVKEREFLGRRIFALPLPMGLAADAANKLIMLHFAAAGDYVAFTTDESLLEEFLRNSDPKAKPLAETAGLHEAAQKVGGMATGFFGYQNDSENFRTTLAALKQGMENPEPGLGLSALTGPMGVHNDGKELKEWFDFSLLPAFEKISKYFNFVVFAGDADANGLNYRFFSPTPPSLRK
jgi:hypothetical protein